MLFGQIQRNGRAGACQQRRALERGRLLCAAKPILARPLYQYSVTYLARLPPRRTAVRKLI
jgi:hypothetical protein